MFLNLYTRNAARQKGDPVLLCNPGDDTETFLLATGTTYQFTRPGKVAFGKIEELSRGIFQVNFVRYEKSEEIGRTELRVQAGGEKGKEVAIFSAGEFDAENYTLSCQAGVYDLEGVNRVFSHLFCFQEITGTTVSVVNSSIQEIITKLITKIQTK